MELDYTRWQVRRAWGEPILRGQLRATPEHFQVDEELGFDADGAGEHLLLQIRKRRMTTPAVIDALAKQLGVRARNIGYCGLKDKDAVTTQWLSVPWPIKTDLPELPAWAELGEQRDGPGVQFGAQFGVVATQRHSRKLRPGSHAANCFRIVVKAAHPLDEPARQALEQRAAHIRGGGFPNAFGAQRFGRDGDNAVQFMQRVAAQAAEAASPSSELSAAKHRRNRMPGILISAARSLVFNRVLDARIADGSWNGFSARLDQETMNLDGTGSVFQCAVPGSANDQARLTQLDIHPTGPMPGRLHRDQQAHALHEFAAYALGLLQPDGSAGELLQAIAAQGVDAARRPLRARADDLDATLLSESEIQLGFTLQPGCFATALIHQLCDCS